MDEGGAEDRLEVEGKRRREAKGEEGIPGVDGGSGKGVRVIEGGWERGGGGK